MPDVQLAFRAALIAVLEHNARSSHPMSSLQVPGLRTGVGELPPERSAQQMKAACNVVIERKGCKSLKPGKLWGEHQDLLP